MTWRTAAALAVGTATAATAAAEWPRHKLKPGFVAGVPDYDYRPTNRTPEPTRTAVSLPRLPVGTDGPTVQVYQLAEARVRVHHCFLSGVAVTLYPDGRYLVSFRADQNPQPTPSDPRNPLRPGESVETLTDRQTSQLRRNEFVLKVRGYTAYPPAARVAVSPGPPALFELPLPPFWVQRGEPYSGLFDGHCEAVRRVATLIDRVEVEFTFR